MRIPAFIQSGSAQIKPTGPIFSRIRNQANLHERPSECKTTALRGCIRLQRSRFIIHVNPPLPPFLLLELLHGTNPALKQAAPLDWFLSYKTRLRINPNPIRSISMSNGFTITFKKVRREHLKLSVHAMGCILGVFLNRKDLQQHGRYWKYEQMCAQSGFFRFNIPLSPPHND